MKFDNEITVKSFICGRFEITLLQDRHGRYRIKYTRDDNEYASEYITDYLTASFMFDEKLKELEGH